MTELSGEVLLILMLSMYKRIKYILNIFILTNHFVISAFYFIAATSHRHKKEQQAQSFCNPLIFVEFQQHAVHPALL